MSTKPVYILGGYQTDFARAWSREGLNIADMIREATLGALENCALDAGRAAAAHPGLGRHNADLRYRDKIERSKSQALVFPHVHDTIQDASAARIQVEGAWRFATLNIGGSCATVVGFMFRVDDRSASGEAFPESAHGR